METTMLLLSIKGPIAKTPSILIILSLLHLGCQKYAYCNNTDRQVSSQSQQQASKGAATDDEPFLMGGLLIGGLSGISSQNDSVICVI